MPRPSGSVRTWTSLSASSKIRQKPPTLHPWLFSPLAADRLRAIDEGGDSHGDLASHIYPRNEAQQDQLEQSLRRTGFDCGSSRLPRFGSSRTLTRGVSACTRRRTSPKTCRTRIVTAHSRPAQGDTNESKGCIYLPPNSSAASLSRPSRATSEEHRRFTLSQLSRVSHDSDRNCERLQLAPTCCHT